MKRVYAVSLGPGPADLITIRARQFVEKSDRVFIQGRDPGWFADWFAKGIGPSFPSDRIRLFMPKPNKWGFARHDPVYQSIAEEIADLANAGKQVSVAALGDASFYSYFTYLETPLTRLGIEWEYVPGIPFMTAASLATGIAFVEACDTLVVKHIVSVSELDSIFSVATVAVLYGIARDMYPQIREYAIQHGIEYARTFSIGDTIENSYAADILGQLPASQLSYSVILRRRHPD